MTLKADKVIGIGQLVRFVRFKCSLLWPPCVIGQAIIFLPCGFFFLLSFFPRLISAMGIGCLPYFYTLCGPSANLECRSETCCTQFAGNAEPKKSPKIPIWAPSHNFVGLYLRNWGTYRQSEKKLFKQQYLLHMCLYYREQRLRSVYQFGAPQLISTGFASWQRYCTAL